MRTLGLALLVRGFGSPYRENVIRLGVAATVAVIALVGSSTVHAFAEDDLLHNADSPDSGSQSFTIQTDKDTGNAWFQAHRFDATEDGDIDSITVRMRVNSAQQNAAASKTSLQIHSNTAGNELDTSLETFTYDSHSLVAAHDATYDDIDVTYTGTASLDADDYWLAIYSTGDRDTDKQSTSLPYSRLNAQVYQGPWRWVSGEQNRYSQTIGAPSYFALANAPMVVIVGTRTNPPPDPDPDPDPEPQSAGTGSSAAPAPVVVALVLDNGLACTTSADSNPTDNWIQLPRADQCTFMGRSETETSPQLLGWSNTADFPIDIATRQVENGWGAYEIDNGPDTRTSIFIPAGGHVQVTDGARLFPILGG